MKSNTVKIRKILQWVFFAIPFATAFLGTYTKDFVGSQIDMLSGSFKIWAVIALIIYTILMSLFCYYWGKEAGESCTQDMIIKGRLR